MIFGFTLNFFGYNRLKHLSWNKEISKLIYICIIYLSFAHTGKEKTSAFLDNFLPFALPCFIRRDVGTHNYLGQILGFLSEFKDIESIWTYLAS